MEHQHERVFAYQLASEISPDEWDNITGGVSPAAIHRTYKITGPVQAPDVIYDVN